MGEYEPKDSRNVTGIAATADGHWTNSGRNPPDAAGDTTLRPAKRWSRRGEKRPGGGLGPDESGTRKGHLEEDVEIWTPAPTDGHNSNT